MKHFFSIVLLFCFSVAHAQKSYQEKVRAYVETYKDWAMQEQQRSGVPASITLAQGILETAAGESELCMNANNHFGIKCKKTWLGQSYTYTDDAKDECFRKYESAYHSYQDHSDFLRNNPRYAQLFRYDVKDYHSWAHGLKKCGYATNPQYAKKLIQFIEDYDLHTFTLLALEPPKKGRMIAQTEEERGRQSTTIEIQESQFESLAYNPADTTSSRTGVVEYYVPLRKNGLNGFYAREGELLLEYALSNKIRYSKLLSWNDLDDESLKNSLFIYTEPKRKKGLRLTHEVRQGETLHSISQEEGIQLASLMALNHLSPGEEPETGAVLFLQNPHPGKIPLKQKQVSVSRQSPPPVEHQGQSRYVYEAPAPAATESSEDEYVVLPKKSKSHEEPLNVAAEPRTATLQVKPVAAVGEKEQTTAAANETQEAEVGFTAHDERTTTLTEEGQPKLEPQNDASTRRAATAKTKEETRAKVEEKPLSPLEKLKRYMDSTVYMDAEPEAPRQEPANETAKPGVKAQSQVATPPVQASQKGANANKPAVHVVKKGDTAFGIAQRYGISVSELQKWNRLPASLVISVGQKLKVKP